MEVNTKIPDRIYKLQVFLFLSPLNNIIPLAIVLIAKPTILFAARIKNIVLTIPFNLIFSKNIKQIKDRIAPTKVVAITMKFPPMYETLLFNSCSETKLALNVYGIIRGPSLNQLHL